eukprot:7377739-Pyramimonas_sp.AAC.1
MVCGLDAVFDPRRTHQLVLVFPARARLGLARPRHRAHSSWFAVRLVRGVAFLRHARFPRAPLWRGPRAAPRGLGLPARVAGSPVGALPRRGGPRAGEHGPAAGPVLPGRPRGRLLG